MSDNNLPEGVPDIYSMSDEELNNVDFDNIDALFNGSNNTPPAEETTDEQSQEETFTEEDDQQDELDNTPEEESGDGEEDVPADSDDSGEQDLENTDTDIDPQLKQLFAPFKANGSEMNVDNVDDAIKLMQMGAGYSQKLQLLKPHLKTVKTLEKAGITGDKLNFLIDVSKGDKDAINKLISDSGFNVDEDHKEEVNYTANTYNVSDSEIDIESALQDVQANVAPEVYKLTTDVLVNKFDEQSKQALKQDPNIIRHLSEDVNSGVYDKISARMERDRILGRLGSGNFLSQYISVGQAMAQEGAFGAPQAKQETPTKDPVKDVDRTQRKKAASTPRQKRTPRKDKPEYPNPLEMSDAEFEALVAKQQH